jgi:hypothetical protein
MADNLQLQTSRLTNASVANLIDDSLDDIENCLRVIFKITADTPISQVMSIEDDGDVTMIGDLTLADEPTEDLHCSTKKYIDDNAANAGNYKCKVRATSDTQVAAAGDEYVVFGIADVEDGSEDQWDSADPTKLVCKSAGDYLIIGYVAYDPIDLSFNRHSPYEVNFSIRNNGSKVIDAVIGQYNDNGVIYWTERSFAFMLTLAEDDYLQLECHNNNTDHGVAKYGCSLSFVKVS